MSPRPSLLTSVSPKSRCSAAKHDDTAADWMMTRRSAAALIDPVSATARNVRSYVRVMIEYRTWPGKGP